MCVKMFKRIYKSDNLYLGLGTMTQEQCPSDKHLRRLVKELSPGKCRELAIELGLEVHEWENFETQFQHQISDDFKFVAVQSCTEKSGNFTFHMLVCALEKLKLSHHLLCKVRLFLYFIKYLNLR